MKSSIDERRHGLRTEGLVTSANSFGMKVGTGLGSAMVGWILALGKYDAAAASQAQTALNSMVWLQIGVPLLLSLGLAALLAFWDMEKQMKASEK
jgi:GPH family glycoside/pentoside/hexuronide:cation symporter